MKNKISAKYQIEKITFKKERIKQEGGVMFQEQFCMVFNVFVFPPVEQKINMTK